MSTMPFIWIEIPAGKVTLKEYIENHEGSTTRAVLQNYGSYDLPAFLISKYPITNAQFATFLEADGYHTAHYWTEEGWQHKENGRWTEPNFWRATEWNQADYPVVGISWYEALAFCHWFSTNIGDQVSLPTEPQWHRAAQGDDGRDCPWGSWDEDEDHCNASLVESWGNHRTSAVYHYEGKGESPFKVVDMLGNVEEWTSTQYQPKHHDKSSISWRIACGGWNPYWYGHLNSRTGLRQDFRLNSVGFRVCRLL